MKRRKYYYNHPFPIDTMKNWLKYKDYHYVTWKGHCTIKELYDIELQPKRRHKRSIRPRNLKRLCGYTWRVYVIPRRSTQA